MACRIGRSNGKQQSNNSLGCCICGEPSEAFCSRCHLPICRTHKHLVAESYRPIVPTGERLAWLAYLNKGSMPICPQCEQLSDYDPIS